MDVLALLSGVAAVFAILTFIVTWSPRVVKWFSRRARGPRLRQAPGPSQPSQPQVSSVGPWLHPDALALAASALFEEGLLLDGQGLEDAALDRFQRAGA